VSCDPPSGSTFTENKNTTVTCNATDAAGNAAEEYCVFFVTVGKETFIKQFILEELFEIVKTPDKCATISDKFI
jgi:hypothetical protein